MYGILFSVAPDPVMNISAQFSPNNTIRGIYNVTWTPPAPTNGSFYQLLQYSYSSAYTIGPTYSDFINITLNQNVNQFTFESNAFYYTNYNFTIITVNIKYNISNGPAEISDQSSPTGMHTYELLYSDVCYCILQYLQLFVILKS